MKAPDTTKEFLTVEHLSYSYHTPEAETSAIKDLSFGAQEGEFISIVGPSGCGKSTLLSLIAGLIKPDTGNVYINGKDALTSGYNIGYMLQRDHLLDWKSTRRNVALGLEIKKKFNQDSLIMINHMLETYGLISFANARPTELSGGMRQRAALIRTLLMQPDLLLLDEPFSALDYVTRLQVSDDICKIIRKENKTAILITHDISEAISTADKVIVLSDRPACIKNVFALQFSSPYLSPLEKRSAPEFSHYFNMIWKELTN